MKDVLDRFKGLRYPSLVRYSKIPVGIEEEDRYQPVTLSVVRHRLIIASSGEILFDDS